jgi:hypothetical protein
MYCWRANACICAAAAAAAATASRALGLPGGEPLAVAGMLDALLSCPDGICPLTPRKAALLVPLLPGTLPTAPPAPPTPVAANPLRQLRPPFTSLLVRLPSDAPMPLPVLPPADTRPAPTAPAL